MAHWAKIDRNNVVTRVIVVDSTSEEQEHQHVTSLYKGTWKKTSYNTTAGVHKLGGVPLRKNFAGIGYTYDAVRDAFIPPKLFPSWVLDDDTCLWKPPVEKPDAPGFWFWDEETTSWVLDPELTEDGSFIV